MFVHGALDDTSWGTQIGRLRESFDLEHAQYLTSTARLRRQQLSDEDDLDYDMRIRVIVRKRPLSNRESTEDVDAVQTLDYDDHGRILVHQPKTKLDLTKEVETTSFSFDNVFDEKSNNESIYTDTVQSLIPGLFRGTWASVFAYGQTGSGKTVSLIAALVHCVSLAGVLLGLIVVLSSYLLVHNDGRQFHGEKSRKSFRE